ncbi:WXG100-like domain-containing protein, partial [Nocardiopsis halotolerans]|uniref:WXG100-like domain-containing protein n=1 Tax=Nocardiopsis halotolerans TaxID=124252 RepID=UPI00059324B6
DHTMPESTRDAIKALTGIEIPRANPAALGQASEIYTALAQRVNALEDLLDLSRAHARRHFDGHTATRYAHSLDQFTTGDHNYLGSARDNAHTMSTELFKARANVEYMHMMVIGQFVQLLAEIAWAVATAKFTFGATLKYIPIFKAIRSLAMRRILTWLLITVPSHQIISQIFASMDSIIQRIQIGRGTRHHKDTDLTKSAHTGATIEGALSAVFSAGLDALFSKQLT